MSESRIDSLLDQLFTEAGAGPGAGSPGKGAGPGAGNPGAGAGGDASERALRSLEADIGIEGAPPRPPRAPQPSAPLLGATALDAQPIPRPPPRPGPSPTGPMPAVRRVEQPPAAPPPVQRAPAAEMPPLGEARRPPPGPPPPMPPRRPTGSMPTLDAARKVTGALPVVGPGAHASMGPPRAGSGPLQVAERRAPPIAAPAAEDPVSFVYDPFALDQETVSGLGLDDFEIGADDAAGGREVVWPDPPVAAEVIGPARPAAGSIGPPAASALGSTDRVARLLVPLNAVPWSGLDPRAGFLLTQVDGRTTFDELVIISALPEAEALALLGHLARLGLVG